MHPNKGPLYGQHKGFFECFGLEGCYAGVFLGLCSYYIRLDYIHIYIYIIYKKIYIYIYTHIFICLFTCLSSDGRSLDASWHLFSSGRFWTERPGFTLF